MPHNLSRGVIAAPVTPFKEDATIDWSVLQRYLASIAAGGAHGIAVNMAAAEGGSLSRDEQIRVVQSAREAVAGACPILSGLIASHTADAVSHAKRLVDAGAEAVVVFPPLPTFLSKPLPVAIVADYHASVADGLGVPVIAFDTANVDYAPGTILALSQIANLIAIKDAVFNIERTADLVEEAEETNGRVSVLTGNDTFILEAMLLGCSGALIGYAGTATAELVRMWKLATAKKVTEAYEIWWRLGPLARLCWRAPLRDYRVRMKYVLARQGVFPNTKGRLPQTDVSERDRAAIDRCFETFGLDDPAYLPSGVPERRARAAASR